MSLVIHFTCSSADKPIPFDILCIGLDCKINKNKNAALSEACAIDSSIQRENAFTVRTVLQMVLLAANPILQYQ